MARLACTIARDSLHFVLVLYVCPVCHKPAEPVRAVTPRTHCYFSVCKIKGAGDSVLEGVVSGFGGIVEAVCVAQM